jgi:hypothetical protein
MRATDRRYPTMNRRPMPGDARSPSGHAGGRRVQGERRRCPGCAGGQGVRLPPAAVTARRTGADPRRAHRQGPARRDNGQAPRRRPPPWARALIGGAGAVQLPASFRGLRAGGYADTLACGLEKKSRPDLVEPEVALPQVRAWLRA